MFDSRVWIFILDMGMLPGRFSITPFRPGVNELPDIVLKTIYDVFLDALREYEIAKKEGDLEPSIEGIASRYAELLLSRFGTSCDVPVQVIPREEFDKRAARGEFGVRPVPDAEKLRDATRMRHIMKNVIGARMRGGSKNLLLRLRRPINLRPGGTACATYGWTEEDAGALLRGEEKFSQAKFAWKLFYQRTPVEVIRRAS